MLYRPLLLLLSLLHSSFIAKHLTMNSIVYMRRAMMLVYIFSLFLFLFRVYAFYSLVHRSDGYLKGKKKERISFTFFSFLSILISTCRYDDVGNHLRSSSIFLSVQKVVVMHFFLAFVLFVFCFFFSLSRLFAFY